MKWSPKANYLHTEIKCTFRHLQWCCSSPFHRQGAAMTLSTTAFGIYFYLMTHIYNPTSGEPPTNLAWLALASTGVFITGCNSKFFGSYKMILNWDLVSYFHFISKSCTPEHNDHWFWHAGFALGWGPIPWLVMSEIFPVKVRGFASAVCVLTNWSMAFLITKTFQNMMVSHQKDLKGPGSVQTRVCFIKRDMMGCVSWHQICTLQVSLTSAGTFWLFSSMCFINVVFTMVFVPETKGKTLEQIEATFRGTSGPWNLFAQLTVKQTNQKLKFSGLSCCCCFFKGP